MPVQQLVLMILDGWGYREEPKYNAIAQANPAYFNSLWATYPHTLFPASGEAVGLPSGIIGTSEIGHSIIGAGRIIDTDMVRINKAIDANILKDNEVIKHLLGFVNEHNSTLHFIGLVSPGGVHSHEDHLYALLRLAKENGVNHVVIHVITDGRDTPPESGIEYVQKLQDFLQSNQYGSVGSISGRYYAMDRDTNWDRIEKAEEVIFTIQKNATNESPTEIIKRSYQNGKGDEFIEPVQFKSSNDKPITIQENDGVFFFNFRPDRARELSTRIAEKKPELNLCFVTMTEYDKSISSLVAFPPIIISKTLASEVSQAGLTQSHIAETEKYAHVTYFLNGGNETPHANEQFFLIPSRKDIPTFDLAPEMKAKEIADKAIEEIEKGINLIVINFANADMVGHTGKMDAAIKAVSFEDTQIQRVVEAILKRNGVAFITADHGNAEIMFDEKTNQPYTAHTLDPVPAILTILGVELKSGSLADVTPTILKLFEIEKPAEMTGNSII